VQGGTPAPAAAGAPKHGPRWRATPSPPLRAARRAPRAARLAVLEPRLVHHPRVSFGRHRRRPPLPALLLPAPLLLALLPIRAAFYPAAVAGPAAAAAAVVVVVVQGRDDDLAGRRGVVRQADGRGRLEHARARGLEPLQRVPRKRVVAAGARLPAGRGGRGGRGGRASWL
jgi:hypothetical protein